MAKEGSRYSSPNFRGNLKALKYLICSLSIVIKVMPSVLPLRPGADRHRNPRRVGANKTNTPLSWGVGCPG
jgi:hypothetical protein